MEFFNRYSETVTVNSYLHTLFTRNSKLIPIIVGVRPSGVATWYLRAAVIQRKVGPRLAGGRQSAETPSQLETARGRQAARVSTEVSEADVI